MRFGDYIKFIRGERELSLRDLAKKSGIDVANLSRIERNVNAPPRKENILESLIAALGLNEQEKQKLLDLCASENGVYPFDAKEDLKEYPNIPVLLRTINNKKLSEEEIRELTERINREY